ncbi:MAG: hypothetical protein ACLPQS_01260 [Acidimicrobiales bacterium]
MTDTSGELGPERASITRRRFLGGSAAVALAAVMAGKSGAIEDLITSLAGDDPETRPNGVSSHKTGPGGPSFVFSVVRPSDLVLLDFSFYGFEREVISDVTTLVPTSTSNVIVVQFPPQAIGEAVYTYHGGSKWYVDPPPVLSALSGPSWLCFTVAEADNVPFPTMTAADLLDWSDWTMLMPAQAGVSDATRAERGHDEPRTTAPNPKLTAIEYPYALYLAPTIYTGHTRGDEFVTTFVPRAEQLVSSETFLNTNGTSEPAVDVVDIFTAALLQQTSGGETLTAEMVAFDTTDTTSAGATPENQLRYAAS